MLKTVPAPVVCRAFVIENAVSPPTVTLPVSVDVEDALNVVKAPLLAEPEPIVPGFAQSTVKLGICQPPSSLTNLVVVLPTLNGTKPGTVVDPPNISLVVIRVVVCLRYKTVN